MDEIEVDRGLLRGVVSVVQRGNHQTGFMIGPRTVATATHGLDARGRVSIRRLGRSSHSPAEQAEVLSFDTELDLCILRVQDPDEFWFVPKHGPLILRSRYLVVSCAENRAETTYVVNEGLVEVAGQQKIKLRSGQIERGYSGAPVIDPSDGQLVGMVLLTRGRQTDLGGHALMGHHLGDVRARLGLDRDDHEMQARHASTGRAWPPAAVVRGTLPAQAVELVGRGAELRWLDETHTPPHRLVLGPSLAGKSALAATWVGIPCPGAGTTAFVDAAQAPPPTAAHPLVSIVLPVLDVDVPPDPFGSRSDTETLGLACWSVMRELRGGRLVVDVQHHPVQDAADADLRALVRAADAMDVVIVLVARVVENDDLGIPYLTPLPIGPLSLEHAAEVMSRACAGQVNLREARDALELLEPELRLPGVIVSACTDQDDALEIVITIGDTRLQERPSKPQESHAPRGGAGEAAVVDGALGETPLGVSGIAALERQIEETATDPLGVRLTAHLERGPALSSFARDAIRLEAWTGTEPFDLAVPSLSRVQGEALTHIAERVASRSLQQTWVAGLHRQIVEAERSGAPDGPPLVSSLPLLRRQIMSGDLPAAQATFGALGGHAEVASILRTSSHAVDPARARLLVMAWWLGSGGDDVGRAVSDWVRQSVMGRRSVEPGDVGPVLNDALAAMRVRPLPDNRGLTALVSWCLEAVGSADVFLADPGTWTRFVSLIARAIDLTGDHDLERGFLVPALASLATHLDLLKSLAVAGDSRPLLTIARQERRLQRVVRARRGARQARLRRAVALLDWTIAHAPSADAFLTLLATDANLRGNGVGDTAMDSDLPVHATAAGRLAAIRRSYRTWLASGPVVDARVVEVEYRLLRAEFSLEGSLLRKARTADERWNYRTIPRKVTVLGELAQERRRRLSATRRRWGESTFAVDMEARTEMQYQTALSIVRGTEIEVSSVDEILARGTLAFDSDPRMALLAASHARHRRDFGRAAELYASAHELALGDPLVRLRAAIGRCESTSQAYGASQCPREQLVDALELARPHEHTDFSASIVCAHARLELTGSLPPAYEDLALLLAAAGKYTRLHDQMSALREMMPETTESDGLSLLQRFLEDFTDAGVLVGLGALLVRSYALSPSDRMERLTAALVVLDGVRLMAGTTWNSPSVNFHQGRALLLACQRTGRADPLGWGHAEGKKDIDVAHSKLQSTSDLSAGSFHAVVRAHLLEAVALRKRLAGTSA